MLHVLQVDQSSVRVVQVNFFSFFFQTTDRLRMMEDASLAKIAELQLGVAEVSRELEIVKVNISSSADSCI